MFHHHLLRPFAVLLLLAFPAGARSDPPPFVPLDLEGIDRTIEKEPAYVDAPRYALFVFDAAGTFRVWAVLDKSVVDGEHYDVLYFDRDGDGDLTEEGERLVTTYREDREPAGLAVTFAVGDVVVPGTGETHAGLRIATKPKRGRQGVWFQMEWRGEVEVSGGYGPAGLDTTIWGETPATAPVLRPTAEGPFSFATWGSSAHVLVPGHAYHVNVLVGHRGAGPDALSVVDEDFLDLERDRLFVTVIARDAEGREVRERSRIQGHC